MGEGKHPNHQREESCSSDKQICTVSPAAWVKEQSKLKVVLI